MAQEVEKATATTRARYDRLAPVYDGMQWLTERTAFEMWRRDLWSRIGPGKILEVGVGTGKNIPLYPPGAQVTAIDLSERMLQRAARVARATGRDVELRVMDAQRLEFAEDEFDTAVGTFVFCSVPMAVEGLRELGRVVRPGGDIWLLEHVRIDRPVVGPLMDLLNPMAVRMMGANINRQTVENVRRAGLLLVEVRSLAGGLVKLMHARPEP
jgi:phosphatidylethanolamine/phosphatidyl-N-methylethanolamine N-methyltransferase